MAQARSPRVAGVMVVGVMVVGLAALVAISLAVPAAAQTEPTTTTSAEVPTGPPDKTVQVLDNIFKPKKVKVVVGTKMTWKWGGVAAHNVVVTKGPQKFKSKTFVKGKFSRTISKPGKYLIVCTIHPGMNMQLRAKSAPPVTTTTTAGVAETQPGA
ncbi:MAG TPA: plastocyanin/azurin family copper-binding protein [Acidimicrobiia bacterium]|nr:plastocyanin/azurin family copper-binding protein [Acidimicrobiia bacterium]